LLTTHGFRDAAKAVPLVKEFVHGPGFSHVSARTSELAVQLMGRVLQICPGAKAEKANPAPAQVEHPLREVVLSDPDRIMARLDSYISRYGARATLYETWAANDSLFKLLLLLFDRSEFLAELAIRAPDLLDEIAQSGRLRRKRNVDQILTDLRKGKDDQDQQRWLRRYFNAEQMRIGLRDILDLAGAEETQAEISALADAFLIYGLEVVMKRGKLRKAPFAVFGLGKLGGKELIYASDLDIIFVAPDDVAGLPKLQKHAADLMELLSRRTEDGSAFDTDARLRPDGEKGLLVNTVSAFEEYYRKRAGLWETQALSRFRFVTGDSKTGDAFSSMAARLANFSKPRPDLHGWSANWKQQVQRMRMRIEKERTPAGKNDLAIKTGTGGLMDAEFLAQTICLERGWNQPNTLLALAAAAQQKLIDPASAERLAHCYRWLIRVERILRRWSFDPESVLPDDPAPLYRVAVRCGFDTPAAFMSAVKKVRADMRSEYDRFFAAHT
jgi:glutamate-ammonia-ligase adenylyltransferase